MQRLYEYNDSLARTLNANYTTAVNTPLSTTSYNNKTF